MDSERYYQPSSSEVKCSSVQIMRQPACRSACRSQEEVTRHQAGVPVDAVEVQTCRRAASFLTRRIPTTGGFIIEQHNQLVHVPRDNVDDSCSIY